ncbi:hypothetical protein ACLOJK_016466 [Asimina triloba]
MGVKSVSVFALALILSVLVSMPTINQAATKIVGGSEHWRFGFNYSDWALKNGPFFQNDTLVFMYDPPNATTFPHSVYLLKNSSEYEACNLTEAVVVGNVTDGGGEGFRFVLGQNKSYFFACGERGGIHCNAGLMKFAVEPLNQTSSCA